MKKIYWVALLLSSIVYNGACTTQSDNTKAEQTTVQETVTGETDVIDPDATEIREAIETIKDFYIKYITCGLRSDEVFSQSLPRENYKRAREHFYYQLDSLKMKHLTARLVKKLSRVQMMTGVDAVLRAQDMNEKMRTSLQVRHLERNWYMVRYCWDDSDEAWAYRHIPVRVSKTDGRYLIDFITPIYHDALYGDSLLLENPVPQPIDGSTPLVFLKTFYAAYVTEYCSMPENLPERLSQLRNKYLTETALAQYKYEEEHADGRFGYDLLIGGYDFSPLWMPSMAYSQLDEETYQLCYNIESGVFTITLKVIQQDGGYRIKMIAATRKWN